MPVKKNNLAQAEKTLVPFHERLLIGLGGQRCGSTWIHEALSRQNGISKARGEKEVHFFDRYYERGIDWYTSIFDQDDPGALHFESSPSYLYIPRTSERIFAHAPGARFLVLLRNPIGRSQSHYRRYLLNHGTTLTFTEAVEARPNILRYSCYADHLARYRDAFGAEKIFVGFYEHIERDPAGLLQQIAEFLGMEQFELPDEIRTKRINTASPTQRGAAFSTGKKLSRQLKDSRLNMLLPDGLNSWAKKTAKRLSPEKAVPPLTEEEMALLRRTRDQEAKKLAEIGYAADKHWYEDR